MKIHAKWEVCDSVPGWNILSVTQSSACLTSSQITLLQDSIVATWHLLRVCHGCSWPLSLFTAQTVLQVLYTNNQTMLHFSSSFLSPVSSSVHHWLILFVPSFQHDLDLQCGDCALKYLLPLSSEPHLRYIPFLVKICSLPNWELEMS